MITDTAIKNAIAKGRNRELKDGTGKGTGRLVLRIRNTGNRVLAEWFVRQWIHGKRRTVKLGTYPTLPLAEARRIFVEEYSPAIESRGDIRRKRVSSKSGNLRDMFDGYVSYMRSEGMVSADETEYTLNRVLQTLDGDAPAYSVTTDDIVELLRPIYARAPAMAVKTRSMISAAYGWAMRLENDYRVEAANKVFNLKGNPVNGTPSDPANAGERWLTAEELRGYWLWLNGPAAGRRGRSGRYIEPSNLAALKLHVLLGQRGIDIVRVRDGYYNKSMTLFEWPKTDTKTGRITGRGHFVPLPPQAVSIMEELQPNEYGLYFPSYENPDQIVLPDTLSHILRRYISETGAAHFCMRDIRRTWKTLAGFAKLTKDERDRLQNHAIKTDVSSKHYDRYEYLDEKRAAMEKWSRWFAENIEQEPASKVVNLR